MNPWLLLFLAMAAAVLVPWAVLAVLARVAVAVDREDR
jgi:hypothetical protein